jgi:membrane protein required for colicin V production
MGIDLIFFGLMLTAFIVGYSKGILKAVFAMASYIIALFLSFKLSPYVAIFLRQIFQTESTYIFVLATVIILITTIFLIRMAGNGLEKILESAKLNFINKAIGGVLLVSFAALLFSGIIWFLNQGNFIADETKKASMTYDFLEKYPLEVYKGLIFLEPYFNEFWKEILRFAKKDQPL